MKNCTYTLVWDNIKEVFTDEQDLDNKIKSTPSLMAITNNDFKFSKDLAKDNIDKIKELSELNYTALTKIKEKKNLLNEEDEDPSIDYGDGFISTTTFARDHIVDSKSNFSKVGWETDQISKLQNLYRNKPEAERNKIINTYIQDTEQSWEDIRKAGKGLHMLAESVFKLPHMNGDIDGFIAEFRSRLRGLTSDEFDISSVDDNALREIISGLAGVKRNLINGRKIKKIFTEPCISYSDENFSVRGKIDVIIVYENNDIDIVDVKFSNKDYKNWDRNKQETAEAQLRLYEAMLEGNGISSGNVRLYIAPIQLSRKDGKYVKANVEEIKLLDPNIGMRHKILGLLNINIETKPVTSEIGKDTIKALSSMFGFDPFNYEIENANFKSYYDKLVTEQNNSKYRFYDAIEKRDVVGTEEEIKQSLKTYIGLLQESKAAITKRIRDHLASKLNSDDIKIGDIASKDIPFFREDFKERTDIRKQSLNRKLNTHLYKYKSQNGWKVIENDDLLQLGVIMFKNDITKEVDFVSVTYDDIESKIPLQFGDTLLGNFYQNSKAESSRYKLDATIGNIELIKLMYISNEFKNTYTIGSLKVINLHDMSTNDDLGIRRDSLEYNYNILAEKSGLSKNDTRSTDIYSQVLYDYQSLINGTTYDSYLQSHGVDKKALEEVNLQKELDKVERLRKLNELRDLLYSTVFKDRRAEEDTSLIGLLYYKVNSAIAYLSKTTIDPVNQIPLSNNIIGGNLFKGLKNGTFLNSTLLNTADTIPVISAISSRVFEGNSVLRTKYNAYKVVDRRHTNKFYEDNGKRLVSNSIVNMHEVSFKNLFDRSDEKNLRLKDYRTDNSLNSTEKAYLKWYLEDLNKYRFPGQTLEKMEDPSRWFDVPLLRATTASRIANGQGIHKAIWSTSGLDIIDPRMEMGMESSDTNYGRNEYTFDGMYNGFKASEDPNTRYNMIKSEGIESFDTNLERIKDTYIFSSMRKDIFDPIVRDISAALVSYAAWANMNNRMPANKPTIDFLVQYIKSSVLDESLIDDEDKTAYKVIGTLKSVASKTLLGLNVLSMAKESVVGWFTIYNNAMANQLTDSNRFGLKEATIAYNMIWKDSVKQLSTITMGEYLNFQYGIANMSPQEMVERQNFGKGNMFRFNERLFWTARAPDYLHRMTILYAYMIKHGCLDAHKVVGDHVEYDWTKDKRFSLYAKDRTGNSIPSSMKEEWQNQRALFEAMKQQMIEEGAVYIKNWETGETAQLTVDDDFLPKAYTDLEAQKIIQEANTMFGYMDTDNKSLYFKKGIGVIIGQFQTFFSAKKNQYFLQRGAYKDGKWVHSTDINGNKLYYTYNDAGEKILTTEITDMPAITWEGSMMEGIFWSLKDLLNIFNLTSTEGRDKLKKAWRDPVKRRNFILALGDLSALGLLTLINFLLYGALTDSEMDYLDRNVSKILTSASAEFNIPAIFTGQLEFQFTGWEVVHNLYTSISSVIAGDKNVFRALSSNLGALRPFKDAIYDATAE